jgi:hypothetical protein
MQHGAWWWWLYFIDGITVSFSWLYICLAFKGKQNPVELDAMLKIPKLII